MMRMRMSKGSRLEVGSQMTATYTGIFHGAWVYCGPYATRRKGKMGGHHV